MVRFILAFGIVILMANSASAQRYDGGWGWGEPRSSTAQEGYLRGWGATARGFGDWIQSLGQYENLHEDARRKYLDNEAHRIRTQWEIRDEHKERVKAAHPDYYTREMAKLDREEKKLEVAARQLVVEKKKEQMIASGELPPPRKYVYKDVEYASYAEFKKTDAYAEKQKELQARGEKFRLEREAELAAQKQREQEATEWLRNWYAKSPGQRMIESERRKRERNLRIIMGEEFWQKHYGDK